MCIPPENLSVKKSGIPHAGKGLFTSVFIAAGTLVVEYLGEIRTWKELEYEFDNDYIYYVNRNHVIDARPAKKALARYANDAEGRQRIPGMRNNAEYYTIGKRVYIKAVKDIPAGSEIFVSYGKEYWDQDKTNREVDASRKKV